MSKQTYQAKSSKDQKMTMISLRIPEDLLAELKEMAPVLGFSGYQPLLRTYLVQGLRNDAEKLQGQTEITTLVENLKEQGVDEHTIQNAIAESRVAYIAARPGGWRDSVSFQPSIPQPQSWGQKTANLLQKLDMGEWEEDTDEEWGDASMTDPVEWVRQQRQQRYTARELES